MITSQQEHMILILRDRVAALRLRWKELSRQVDEARARIESLQSEMRGIHGAIDSLTGRVDVNNFIKTTAPESTAEEIDAWYERINTGF